MKLSLKTIGGLLAIVSSLGGLVAHWLTLGALPSTADLSAAFALVATGVAIIEGKAPPAGS